jgi:hypothetical protein
MRLHVVHDASGRIIAAAEVAEDGPTITPLPGPRQTATQLEVPDEVAGEQLDVICTRMRVDAANNRLAPVDG